MVHYAAGWVVGLGQLVCESLGGSELNAGQLAEVSSCLGDPD